MPRYAVNIIRFGDGSSSAAGNELFLPDAAQTDASAADEVIPEFGDLMTPEVMADDSLELEEVVLPSVAVNLAATPRNELTLQEVYSELDRLDAYEPVLWTGWTQDAIERDMSPEIPLRRIGNAPPGFDGSLQLYLNRFLHLVVDLTMTEAALPGQLPPDRATAGGLFADSRDQRSSLVRMRISEDRIMKNGDLRYFDHPKFGLLATVTRLEDPEEDDSAPGEAGVSLP